MHYIKIQFQTVLEFGGGIELEIQFLPQILGLENLHPVYIWPWYDVFERRQKDRVVLTREHLYIMAFWTLYRGHLGAKIEF